MYAIVFVVVFLLLDQLTKYLAQKFLVLGDTVPLVKGALHLTLVHNSGAAFGIFKNQTILFIFISLSAIVLLFFIYKRLSKDNIFLKIACILVLSGALGNLIDRTRLGYVIDFIDLRVWPVFNAADSCITIGACMFAYILIIKKGK